MYLLFDIGGTKTRLAISRDKKTLAKFSVFSTPKTFKEAVFVISGQARALVGKNLIIDAVGGVAGRLDIRKKQLINSPNLPDWIGKPLQKLFETIISGHIYFENDTALAGLGEATKGLKKKYPIVVYITVSTGVNGARIVDGKIDKNILGFEIGHQIIDMRKPPYHSRGGHGHLEGYISGSAIEKRFGQKPKSIKNKKIWREIARYLAYGLNNTIVYWSPNIIILGGSIMNSVPIPLVAKELKFILTTFPKYPKIARAKLGDKSGLYGALEFYKTIRPAD